MQSIKSYRPVRITPKTPMIRQIAEGAVVMLCLVTVLYTFAFFA